MSRLALSATLVCAGLLSACASVGGPQPQYIGTARMLADLSIEQQVVAREGGEGLGEARIVIKPGDPAWRETFELVGGLRPGEMKAVPAQAAPPPHRRS